MSEDRLRRQLQAQAVVNRQLHAQLAEVTAELRAVQGNDASTVRVLWRRLESVLPRPVASRVERRVRGALGVGIRPPRRPAGSGTGSVHAWLDDLRSTAPADRPPALLQNDDGAVFLIEGTQRRPINRMLVIALLETELGPARAVSEAELDEYDEGPPVEVFAPVSGRPFVIVGGRRRPIAGYPVPFQIDDDDAEQFDEGEPLRVARIQGTRPDVPVQRRRGSTLGRLRDLWSG